MPADGRTTTGMATGATSGTAGTKRTGSRTTGTRGRTAATTGQAATGSSGAPKRPSRAPRARTKAELAELASSVRGATLYLAEKHSIALALADVLPGSRTRLDGCIRCGENAVITWLSGHLLELAPPDAYNAELKSWRRETLPIVPERFRLLARTDKGASAQLEVVKALLSACPSAVNAADFDREGQLLVDEVLELVNYPGSVLRLQTRALDNVSLRRELGRMRPNNEFAGMREAARARSQLDWLAGINLTRAMTIHGRACGATSVLSLGRVQTPTLALIVARDLEIENFVPKPFYKLSCPFALPAGELVAKLVTNADMPGCDEEKRLVDRDEALAIAGAVSGHTGEVVLVEKKRVSEQPPLPYNLTELQKEASARFGLGAQTTLAACQRMYEARFISYPRTDCQYLPNEQLAEAPEVLMAVAAFEGMAEMVEACDANRVSPAWNTSKVTAHHAIIPTTVAARGLSQAEAKVYTLICRRYAWQFLPPHVYFKSRVDIGCEGYLWRANGRKEVEPGWTEFRFAGPATARGRAKDDEQKDVLLPNAEKGEEAKAGDVQVDESMTTPPSRFTEGTLVDAMENVQRYLKGASADDQKILKKTEGLGTVATRAGIIETLFDRGYIAKEGKAIMSTGLGRDLVRNSPDCIKDPLMTANMERSLSEIQEGRLGADEYVASYASSLPGVIDSIFATSAVFTDTGAAMGGKAGRGAGRGTPARAAGEGGHACPKCGRELVPRTSARGPFWGCSGFPSCRFLANDRDGEPDCAKTSSNASADTLPDGGHAPAAAGNGARTKPMTGDPDTGEFMTGEANGQGGTCPRCGKPLVRRTSARGPFWGCSGFPSCRHIAREGEVSTSMPSPQGGGADSAGAVPPGGSPGTGGTCPRCGRALVSRRSARGPFWGCSGFPACRYTRDAAEEAGASSQTSQGAPAGASRGASGGFSGAQEDVGQGQGSARARADAGFAGSGGPRPGLEGSGTLPGCGDAARVAGKAEASGREGSVEAPLQEAANTCPRCGRALVSRRSARGPFLGCSGFPACRYTRDAAEASPAGGLAGSARGDGQGTAQEPRTAAGRSRTPADLGLSAGPRDAWGDLATSGAAPYGSARRAESAGRTAFEESAMAMTHDLGPEDVDALPWAPGKASDILRSGALRSGAFQSGAFQSGAFQPVGQDGVPDLMPAGEPPFEDIPWDEEAEAQYEEWARSLEEPEENG